MHGCKVGNCFVYSLYKSSIKQDKRVMAENETTAAVYEAGYDLTEE